MTHCTLCNHRILDTDLIGPNGVGGFVHTDCAIEIEEGFVAWESESHPDLEPGSRASIGRPGKTSVGRTNGHLSSFRTQV